MLKDSFPFSSFSTNDLSLTYNFYREVLGLEVELIDNRFLHLYLPSGSYVVIYTKNNHRPSSYTVLNFQIKDIESKVDELSRKGVKFEQYGPPIKTDAKGISWDDEGSHIAWFKDPGGNILGLIEN
ncbi:MAG: VOC family protein [Bacteroidota bacterium]